MTEPTEVENSDTLADLARAFDAVREENDEALAGAPERTAASRVDQTAAARDLRLSWQSLDGE